MAGWRDTHEAVLSELVSTTADEECTLGAGRVLGLLKAAAEHAAAAPPQNLFVSRARLAGRARADAAYLRCDFRLTLLKGRATAARLLPGNVAVLSSSVKFRRPGVVATAADAASAAASEGEGAVVSAVDTPDELFGPALAGQSIGLIQNNFCLVCEDAGEYWAQLEVLVPYATSRKTGFSLRLPRTTSPSIEFTVEEPDVLIKVDPSLLTRHDSRGSGKMEEGVSTIFAHLPPGPAVVVNWTSSSDRDGRPPLAADEAAAREAAAKEAAARRAEPLLADASHEYLLALAEGVLGIEDTLTYTVHAGQMPLIEIGISPGMRVLNAETADELFSSSTSAGVDGDDSAEPPQVKRWEVAPAESKGEDDLLRVWLEYAAEGTFHLRVTAEVELDARTTAAGVPEIVMAPRLVAVRTDGVTREKGYLAVVSDSNVEVAEVAPNKHPRGTLRRSGNGIALVDASELPAALRAGGAAAAAAKPSASSSDGGNNSGTNVLFAYKFLLSSFELAFSITKHSECGVLVALVEAAHYEAVVTPHGTVVYRCGFKVKNTQKQYLRVRLPRLPFGRVDADDVGGDIADSPTDTDSDSSDPDSDDGADKTKAARKKKKTKSSRARGGKSGGTPADAVALAEAAPLGGRHPGKETFALWSTILGTKPVKPAHDESGQLLLPLFKQGHNDKKEAEFYVELTYTHYSPDNVLDKDQPGRLRIRFPQVDLPINTVASTIYFPRTFTFDDLTGMRSVSTLAGTMIPIRGCGPNSSTTPSAPSGRRNNMRENRQERMQRAVMYNQMDNFDDDFDDSSESLTFEESLIASSMSDDSLFSESDEEETQMLDDDDDDDDGDAKPAAALAGGSGGAGRGLMPVDVDLPRSGYQVYFRELLIVSGRKLEVVANYKTAKDHRKRRNLDKKRFC